MHEHVKKKDFEIGAEKLGMLLLLRSKLFMAPHVGVEDRCLTIKNRNSFLFTMIEEFEMFVNLKFVKLKITYLNFIKELTLM